MYIKQLLDEVFVISRVIKIEVGVIRRSRRLRLITLTETLIILDITKTESDYCFIRHWTKQKNSYLCFFTDSKQNKASELGMITLRNHVPQSYTTWLPVTLTWLLYNLQLWCHRRWFRKLTVRFRPISKEIVSSMYNNVESMHIMLDWVDVFPLFCPQVALFSFIQLDLH